MLGLYLPALQVGEADQDTALAHPTQGIARRRFIIIEELHDIHALLREVADHDKRKGARITYVDLSKIQSRPFRPSVSVEYPYNFWGNGDSYLVLGDPVAVLRTIPDDTVHKIYRDSPFHATFSPATSWQWDDHAKQRLAELERIHRRRLLLEGRAKAKLPDVQLMLDYIRQTKQMEKTLASYMTWVSLAVIECYRIAGKRENLNNLFWRATGNYVPHSIPTHIRPSETRAH